MRAFIFPGQGSQVVGMGASLAEASARAREVFSQVDDALGQQLFRLMREGPQDELILTENAQPAILANTIATLRVLEEECGVTLMETADFVAGHSLGEYAALCAAGALDLGQTARLLKLRGQVMQAAVPMGHGAMAALIGSDLERVTALAAAAAEGEICFVANDNDPSQVVISGHRGAIERAIARAADYGVTRSVLLSVSAPFHSPLMQPAADAIAEALSAMTIVPPRIPLYANATAAPVTDAETIRRMLVTQVTGAVRWRESVAAMFAAGVNDFIEVGGKVLAPMIIRTAPAGTCTSVVSIDDIRALREAVAAGEGLTDGGVTYVAGATLPQREGDDPGTADSRAETAGEAGSLRAFYGIVKRGKPVAPQDSFASLGGDSLAYVRAMLEIERLIGDVPDGWETMPIAELEARAAAKKAGARGLLVKLETEVLMRAAAISAVVMLHAHLASFAGGAELLMLLAGYNIVRFQRERLFGGRALEIVRTFFLNFMLPYLGLMLLYSGVKGEAEPASWFFVSNYFGRFSSILEPYWFLEALFQCLLIICLLLMLPSVRALALQRTRLFVIGLFGIAVIARLLALAFEPATLENRTAESVLYLFTGGMAFHMLAGSARFIVAMTIILLSVASWGLADMHPLWLALALGGLAFRPQIWAPAPIRTLARQIAGASFYIYMVHSAVIWLIVYHLGLDKGALPAAASLLIGWACWRGHAAWQRGRAAGDTDPFT